MCGVAGLIDLQRRTSDDDLRSIGEQMAAQLRHRGPDDAACWVDAPCGVALAHTRLSIVDLSPAGAQPMSSSCGRFFLSYNGEVYNADELRTELRSNGRSFRGHSDTEVMVEGFAVWGVQGTVERLIGMFAFAVWDRQEQSLFLVRDRIGIKPMYWGKIDGRVFFGSELKAFRHLPFWRGELDLDSVAAYLRYSFIPAPRSIFQNVRKLQPGRLLQVRPDGECRETAYWSLSDVAVRGRESRRDMSDLEARDLLDTLLADAVERRMVADVPLGAFLSGGIDSSTVVALMQKASARPVRTFSLGFAERSYDESSHAAAVAAHLRTDHTQLVVTPAEAQAAIMKMPAIFDEPFADSSQIPTYIVSELTRRHVTVALSGDGGDELFGGYNRYGAGYDIAARLRFLPQALRVKIADAMLRIRPDRWDAAFALVPQRLRPRQAGEKMHKLATVLPEDAAGYYERLISPGGDTWKILGGVSEPTLQALDSPNEKLIPDEREWMQFMDAAVYLPDDILTKVDRASMAVSLEARVPLLDHRVVELAWQLPRRFEIRDGQGKWLLRQVLYKYIPKSLVERPKMGFAVPLGEWLRGPLRDWAEELLNPAAIDGFELFDARQISVKWAEHQSGKRDWQHALWNILMFECWRREHRAA